MFLEQPKQGPASPGPVADMDVNWAGNSAAAVFTCEVRPLAMMGLLIDPHRSSSYVIMHAILFHSILSLINVFDLKMKLIFKLF